jgi:hypothetical protein
MTANSVNQIYTTSSGLIRINDTVSIHLPPGLGDAPIIDSGPYTVTGFKVRATAVTSWAFLKSANGLTFKLEYVANLRKV